MICKIFGIGLSRTGTTSLHEYITNNTQYTSVHYPNMLELKEGRYDAFFDIPVALTFAFLDGMFPHSKFVYTVRDNWIDAVEPYFLRKQNRPNQSKSQLDIRTAMYGSAQFDRERYAEAYRKHDWHVRNHFKDRPQDLLILNITAGDTTEALNNFIGNTNQFAPKEFPHANAKKDWK